MRYTPTRCGVRTHASYWRPDLKSGALNHSANLVLTCSCQRKNCHERRELKGLLDYHKFFFVGAAVVGGWRLEAAVF